MITTLMPPTDSIPGPSGPPPTPVQTVPVVPSPYPLSQSFVAGLYRAATTNLPGNEGLGQRTGRGDGRDAGMVLNELRSRMEFFRSVLEQHRDIDRECGHPTEPWDAATHQNWFDIDAIASRVVKFAPRETWQVQPSVYETNEERVTPFEEAWDNLSRQLRSDGEFANHYSGEAGSPVWEVLSRADMMCGIGRYGIIYLGLDDVRPDHGPELPVEIKQGRRLLFMRVFTEAHAKISAWEEDTNSSRYGQPTEYEIVFADPSSTGSTVTSKIHWHRVIHVVDNLEGSEFLGKPRMEAVRPQLLDLRKLYGGSAEMYWRGALPGWALSTHPSLGGNVEIDAAAVKQMMWDWQEGLQRYLTLKGLTAESLAPQVVDPTPQIERQLDAICIEKEVPKRVFIGSERGELSSAQDESTWNDRVKGRQWGHVTPRLIVPFTNRLIGLGVLPVPKGGYLVWWPDISSQSKGQQADVAVKMTAALTNWIRDGADVVFPPKSFYTVVMGLTDEEAQAVIDAAVEALDRDPGETGGSPLLRLVGGVTAMTELFGKFKDGALSEESLKQLIMLFYQVDEARAEEIIADGLPESPAIPPGTVLPGLPAAGGAVGDANPAGGADRGRGGKGGGKKGGPAVAAGGGTSVGGRGPAADFSNNSGQ